MITVPAWLLSAVLWLALGALVVAAGWLAVVLAREWRAGRLW
jgi:hypothetical protein